MSHQPETIRDLTVSTADSGVKQSRIPWSRKILALLIAVAVDAPPLCVLGESIPVLFDVGVATLLWLVLGRSRLLAVALLIECIPGVGLAPTWSLYVLWEIIFSTSGKTPAAQTPLAIEKNHHGSAL